MLELEKSSGIAGAVVNTERLVLVVRVKKHGSQGPIYESWLEGTNQLFPATSCPWFAGARELIKLGYDPSTPYVMRYVGEKRDALMGILGRAAKLRIKESDQDGVVVVAWKPLTDYPKI